MRHLDIGKKKIKKSRKQMIQEANKKNTLKSGKPIEPNDGMKNSMKSLKQKKHIAFIIISAMIISLLLFFGIAAYRILEMPQSLFPYLTIKPSTSFLPNSTPSISAEFLSTTGYKDILNILLVGIDRHENGDKSYGDPHADVMMIVAVNFKENKVDLVSLPRDTFVHNTELMNGVYKLNGSFNVGGGYDANNGEGFEKVCEAAEYMLGGIPVDYYYAVDFASLENVVNLIGGVDYYVESPEYVSDGIGGQRHLNGKLVLSYLRVRKTGPEQGDKNRVNRQKKMLIAIFSQLKKYGKLSMIPDLLNTADTGLFTNTNLSQTLALVNFASSINPDSIGEYSMEGKLLFKASWNYCFTDQDARVQVIKQIYGVDVPKQVHCSPEYADWLVANGFSGIRYLKTSKQLIDDVTVIEASLTNEKKAELNTLRASYTSTKSLYDTASLTLSSSDTQALLTAEAELKRHTETLAKIVGYNRKFTWTYNPNYWEDPAINEVNVNFR